MDSQLLHIISKLITFLSLFFSKWKSTLDLKIFGTLKDFTKPKFRAYEISKRKFSMIHWNQFHVKSLWQKNWATFLSDPIVMNEPVSFKGTLRLGGVPNYRDIWLIDLSIYGLPHEKKQSETKALTEVLNEWPNQDCPLRYVAWNPSTYLGLREQKLWGIL